MTQPTLSISANRAGDGLDWLADGFRLFRQYPGTWIGTCLVLMALSLAIGGIPLLGAIAGILLKPIFTGGLMMGCAEQSRGGSFRIGHLFSGFDNKGTALMKLGLIYLGLTLLATLVAVAVVVVMLLASGASMAMLEDMSTWQEPSMAPLMILLCILIFLLLYIPLLMGYWLSPALIVEQDLEPWQAFKLSFKGCLKNIVPALVYGLVTLFWMILATLPLLLGWLILGPTLIASNFAAYQHIFKPENNLV